MKTWFNFNDNTFLLSIWAYFGFFASLITPDNISIIAGGFSIVLSLSGIVLNLIKIYKNKKSKQNEKTF
jgi:hypothetical protein